MNIHLKVALVGLHDYLPFTKLTSNFAGSSVSEIAKEASEKLAVNPEDCVIFEMKSTGEKVIFKESDTCIITTISHNGRLAYFLPLLFVQSYIPPAPAQDICS